MKRIATTMIAALALTSSVVAQTNDNRITAKGFALFSAKDTFHPYKAGQ